MSNSNQVTKFDELLELNVEVRKADNRIGFFAGDLNPGGIVVFRANDGYPGKVKFPHESPLDPEEYEISLIEGVPVEMKVREISETRAFEFIYEVEGEASETENKFVMVVGKGLDLFKLEWGLGGANRMLLNFSNATYGRGKVTAVNGSDENVIFYNSAGLPQRLTPRQDYHEEFEKGSMCSFTELAPEGRIQSGGTVHVEILIDSPNCPPPEK